MWIKHPQPKATTKIAPAVFEHKGYKWSVHAVWDKNGNGLNIYLMRLFDGTNTPIQWSWEVTDHPPFDEYRPSGKQAYLMEQNPLVKTLKELGYIKETLHTFVSRSLGITYRLYDITRKIPILD